jgi:hypothetical protein
MSYCLLIDLLRSIQHGQPASFPTALFLHLKQPREDNTRLATAILPLVDERFENPLIAIISMLADAHLVTTVFDPLTTQSTLLNDSLSRYPAAWMTNTPFTPTHEIGKLRLELLAGVLKWNNNHMNTAPRDVALMYHFCHLYTSVPNLQSLFILSGYAKQPFSISATRREHERASSTLLEYCSAVPIAWKIIETSEAIPRDELPLWAPLSVFSAGLIIWARTAFADDDKFDSSSVRSLTQFKKELARMNFSGAEEMSAIIASLGQRPSRASLEN